MTKKLPPPAPKGNKRALGCKTSGVPATYTPQWLQNEAALFREWMELPESIFFKSFALERGYSPQRLVEFAEKSPEFAEALGFAKDWQEAKLVNFGLFNKTNSNMTKFVLTNCHNWDQELTQNNNLSHVQQLAESIRAQTLLEAEAGDSDGE